MVDKILQTLLSRIKEKNSWGKNELINLIAEITVKTIDEKKPAKATIPKNTMLPERFMGGADDDSYF